MVFPFLSQGMKWLWAMKEYGYLSGFWQSSLARFKFVFKT